MKTKSEISKRVLNPVVFTKPGTKLSNKFISILPKGGILFSAGLVHEAKVNTYRYCVLAYDEGARAILLQLTSDEEREGIIKLTHRITKNTSLQCGSFFKFFNLDPANIAGRYKVEKNNVRRQGEWMTLYLDEQLKKGN